MHIRVSCNFLSVKGNTKLFKRDSLLQELTCPTRSSYLGVSPSLPVASTGCSLRWELFILSVLAHLSLGNELDSEKSQAEQWINSWSRFPTLLITQPRGKLESISVIGKVFQTICLKLERSRVKTEVNSLSHMKNILFTSLLYFFKLKLKTQWINISLSEGGRQIYLAQYENCTLSIHN